MTDIAATLLEALRAKRAGAAVLTHEEIEQHPDLGAEPPDAIEGAVRELAGLGAVEPHREKESRYEFDWVALLPTE
jgi:hypothetical protein